jgi:hypothetical protein
MRISDLSASQHGFMITLAGKCGVETTVRIVIFLAAFIFSRIPSRAGEIRDNVPK